MSQMPPPDDARPPGMPRWVKVTIALGVVVLIVAIVAVLMGGHGPGRHA
jgi:hypothetical protein